MKYSGQMSDSSHNGKEYGGKDSSCAHVMTQSFGHGTSEGRTSRSAKTERGTAEFCGGQCWNGWLMFLDRSQEEKFWTAHQQRFLLKLDSFCCSLGTIFALTLWFRIAMVGKIQLPIDHILTTSLAGFVAVQAYRQNRWYMKHRTVLIGTLRVALYMCLMRYMPLIEPPAASTRVFLLKMLLGSTVPALGRINLMLQLQFKQQLISTIMCLLIAAMYGCRSYCEGWFPDGEATAVSEPIWSGINKGILHYLLVRQGGGTSFNDNTAHTCCLVVLFLHAVMGCVLPIAFLYCVECWLRLSYLRAQGFGGETNGRVLYETIIIACWVSVVGSVMLWSVLHVVSAAMGPALLCTF